MRSTETLRPLGWVTEEVEERLVVRVVVVLTLVSRFNGNGGNISAMPPTSAYFSSKGLWTDEPMSSSDTRWLAAGMGEESFVRDALMGLMESVRESCLCARVERSFEKAEAPPLRYDLGLFLER